LKTAPAIRIAIAAFALAATAMAPRARAATLEYPVKAAFLYKFAPFVEWPPRAFDSGTSPLTLCVVGFDPFGATLDKAIDGQRIGARPVVARRLETIGAGSGCHIAYIGGSRAQPVAEGLAALAGSPVLTVTDQSMGSARGAVHFVIKDDRVRFHIDDAEAAGHGVNISSKLMRLALSVRLRKGGRG
jgi:hypothetical protein